jgi:LysM repeat protein
MTHVLRQDWIDDTPSTGSSSGLIMFGLVLGVLLLVPLLMMCGDSSAHTSGEDLDALLEASPPAVTESSQTITDGDSSTAVRSNVQAFAATTSGAANTTGATTQRGVAATRPNAAATPDTGTSGQEYIIGDGDTLWGIATQFGITVEALTAANGLSPDAFLQPGESITIPPAD